MTAPITQVVDFWRARGWRVTLQPTQAPGHATELAKTAAASGCRMVIAAGGDGTLGEVANGLALTDTIMAPLPAGTANSFAKELGMPLPGLLPAQNLLAASQALANGRIQRMDLGFKEDREGNGRYWMLWSGTGADGYIVHRIEPRPKWSKWLGPLGYVLQGLIAAPAFPTVRATITVDDQIFKDEYILINMSNVRLYGGEVLLNPNGRLDDGVFELWLFRGRGLARILRYIAETLLARHVTDPGVTVLQARQVTVETRPIIGCHTDGERSGFTPLRCRIVPGALRLLVPNTTPPDLFQHPGEPLTHT